MKSVSIICCTGERPEAFALCEKYLARQSYKGRMHLIVVDDGNVSVKCNLNQEYVRSPRLWTPDYNSQRDLMNLGLARALTANTDLVLFAEDDDFLAINYVEEMVKLLEVAPIAGGGAAKYYHISAGWKQWGNFKHASLASTGLRREYIPLMNQAVNSGELYFDVFFWALAEKQKIPRLIFNDSNIHIGMKGLPGRKGIGAGHTKKDYFFDANYTKLKEWVGEDAKPYIEMATKLKQEAKK